MSYRDMCFKCKRNFNSNDPDDEIGNSLCPRCKKESKAIARMIDEENAKKPKKQPKPKLKPFDESADGRIKIYSAKQLI